MKSLHKFIIEKKYKELKELVKKPGTNVNEILNKPTSAYDKTTPLTLACYMGDEDTVSLLIAHGANVNKKDGRGATPLYMAAQEGKTSIVKKLLKADASIHDTLDTPEFKGVSPLTICVDKDENNSHAEIIKLLIENGINIISTLEFFYPYDKNSKVSGQKEKLRNLLTSVTDVSHLKNVLIKQTHIFLLVLFTEEIMAVERFLAQGLDVNAEYPFEGNAITPLCHVISLKLSVSLFQYLVSKGANINQAIRSGDFAGHNPLYLAALSDHVEAAKSMLKDGLRPNVALASGDDIGETPFFVAAQLNRTKTLELFLQQDKSLANETLQEGDNQGITVLYMAAAKGQYEAVDLLIKYGANPNKPSGEGKNKGLVSLYPVIQEGHLEVFKLLLEKQANPFIEVNRSDLSLNPIFYAVYLKKLEFVKLIKEKYSDFYLRELPGIHKGFSLLHVAASSGNIALFEYLISCGADVKVTKDGLTPFGVAIAFEQISLAIRILGKWKIKINEEPINPLKIAVLFHSSMKCLTLLLNQKCGVNDVFTYQEATALFGLPNAATSALYILLNNTARQWFGEKSYLFTELLDGCPILLVAVLVRNDTAVEELLKLNNIDINQAATGGVFKGITPIVAAFLTGTLKAFELLIAKADVEKPITAGKYIGKTPLHLAINTFPFNKNFTLELLESKFQVAKEALEEISCDMPPLIALIKNNSLTQAEVLLQHGANLNESIKRGKFAGYTALCFAIINNNLSAVELCIKYKVKIHVSLSKTFEKQTYIDLAIKYNSDPIISRLKAYAETIKKTVDPALKTHLIFRIVNRFHDTHTQMWSPQFFQLNTDKEVEKKKASNRLSIDISGKASDKRIFVDFSKFSKFKTIEQNAHVKEIKLHCESLKRNLSESQEAMVNLDKESVNKSLSMFYYYDQIHYHLLRISINADLYLKSSDNNLFDDSPENLRLINRHLHFVLNFSELKEFAEAILNEIDKILSTSQGRYSQVKLMSIPLYIKCKKLLISTAINTLSSLDCKQLLYVEFLKLQYLLEDINQASIYLHLGIINCLKMIFCRIGEITTQLLEKSALNLSENCKQYLLAIRKLGNLIAHKAIENIANTQEIISEIDPQDIYQLAAEVNAHIAEFGDLVEALEGSSTKTLTC